MRLLRALGVALWFAVLAWLFSAALMLLLHGVWAGDAFLGVLGAAWGGYIVWSARNFARFVRGDAP